jgi:hypothetical protein
MASFWDDLMTGYALRFASGTVANRVVVDTNCALSIPVSVLQVFNDVSSL